MDKVIRVFHPDVYSQEGHQLERMGKIYKLEWNQIKVSLLLIYSLQPILNTMA